MKHAISLVLVTTVLLVSGCSGPLLRIVPLIKADRTVPHFDEVPSVESPEFKALTSAVLGTPFTEGNLIDTYVNGDQIFPAMLQSIRSARLSILLESYILWDGSISRQVIHALQEKAAQGVRVQLLLDWHGSQQANWSELEKFGKSGAEVLSYHSLSWYNPLQWKSVGKLDNRTHRRILVVDGSEAFTGGVGIADEWRGNARNANEWRDTHFRIRGPAVTQIAGVFAENWWSEKGELKVATVRSPSVPSRPGCSSVQVSRSSPGSSAPAGITTFILALQSAKRTIRISTPYFVPEGEVLEQLRRAANRGVKIEIIVPGKEADKQVLRSASRNLWGDLLKSGVSIYEFEPSLYHTKLLVVDDTFVSFGTTNWDSRSLRYNDEIIVNVLDTQFAREQIPNFERDKTFSHQVTLSEWESRSWITKAFDWLAGRGDGEM